MAELLKFNRQEIEELIQQGRKNEIIKYDLRGADLHGLDLSCMDLYGKNLSYADLRYADLFHANLSTANLSHANLSTANLCNVNLCNVNLNGACLYGANLSETNLREADLSEVDLSRAYLFGANLNKAKCENIVYNEGTSFFALQCPEKGSFIGFKKANGYIVELKIPANAKRSSATSRKCRCSKAKVLSITLLDGTDDGTTSVCSDRDPDFVYKIGKIVKVDDFDEDRWHECSTGIHFFMTRDEAVKY